MDCSDRSVPRKDDGPTPYIDPRGNVWYSREEAELAAEVDAKQERHANKSADELADLAARWTEINAREDADAEMQANRKAGGKAGEAIVAALAAGKPWAEAIEDAKVTCGRDDLHCDDRPRAAHHRREVFGQRHALNSRRHDDRRPEAPRRATPSGRPRASATRSSARSGDSGDSDPDQAAPGRAGVQLALWFEPRIGGWR
jgi:hypothetical protein